MKGTCKITDNSGRVVINTLSNQEQEAVSADRFGVLNLQGGKTRIGKKEDASGIMVFASRDPDLLKSAKVFNAHLDVLSHSMDFLVSQIAAAEERSAAKSRRLVHNLTTLNGHMIQDIYSVLPQERLAGSIRRGIPFIAKEMQGQKAHDFARCFLSMAKNSTAMKNEFSVFKKIDLLETSVDKRPHSAHKVVMNVGYLFFTDFADMDSFVDVSESDLKVFMDYECAFVALYHLFDNASKYICRGTNLDISITSDTEGTAISYSMCSLPISDTDLSQLFAEGFSGDAPKKLGLHGDGVGMSLVKRVMDMHEGKIEIIRDPKSTFIKDESEYQRNTFKLTFPMR